MGFTPAPSRADQSRLQQIDFSAPIHRFRRDAALGDARPRHLSRQTLAPLDAWINDAIDSKLTPIMRFARVLRNNIEAVNNAIELP